MLHLSLGILYGIGFLLLEQNSNMVLRWCSQPRILSVVRALNSWTGVDRNHSCPGSGGVLPMRMITSSTRADLFHRRRRHRNLH